MAITYCGLEISDLFSFKTPFIETNSKINAYILELKANHLTLTRVQSVKILEKIIQCLLRKKPENFAEFLLHTRIAVFLLLLKDLPNSFMEKRSAVVAHTFNIKTENWNCDILKICTTANYVNELTTDTSNIIFLTSNIWFYSEFTRSVCLRLLSTGFTSINTNNNKPSNNFQMLKCKDLLNILNSVTIEEDSIASVKSSLNLLSLYAVYQRVFLSAATLKAKNELPQSLCEASSCNLKNIKISVEKIQIKLHGMIQKNLFMNECILMFHLIEYDILSILNDKINGSDNNEFEC